MKISSKSILSPGRAGGRDTPLSLSTSLSRRLRNSGSIKGGASPAMFPTTAKKRSSFENPEPSSPKVTCIGQVRVKSKKKQAKKLRTLSRRRSAGEVSFRTLEHPVNGFTSEPQSHRRSQTLGSKGVQSQELFPAQRSWVHFPVTICDALRAFGSEFSCLFPCRTSCSDREKEEKMVTAEEGRRQGSCGAVFARWLVAVQDGDGGGERDIELVVGEEDGDESFVRKSRRHVFEDLEIINDRIEGHKDDSRLSICIPPKNALLLMRCRNQDQENVHLFEANQDQDQENVQLEGNQDQENLQLEGNQDQDQENVQQLEANQDQENVQQFEGSQDQEQEQENARQFEANQDQENVQLFEANQDQDQENVQQFEANQEQENVQQFEANLDQENGNVQQDEVFQDQEQEQEESLNLGLLFEEIEEHNEAYFDMEEAHEEVTTMVTEFAEKSETHEEEEMVKDLERESEMKEERESRRMLPECLLLMSYEPKLSMEILRETWVCSADFIKRNSNRRKLPPPAATGRDEATVNAADNDVMRVPDGGCCPVLQQPARSSCSLPAAPAMATVLGQKLADAVGYEPFVLTRCKSEPMKTAAAKLLPESCVLENRKLERLSGVTFGVGAAGLGF